MKKEPLFVALSNQKGGVGKSTFTVLLASYFHYLNGYNVLVVDCDYPQHSISAMRDWEVGNIEKNVHLQNLLVEQFGTSGRKAYSILNSTPEEARETAGRFLEKSELDYDLVLFDLPGTVNVPGVFQSVINMDYVFTPITQERMVMRSSMSFVLAIRGNTCTGMRTYPCVASICSGIGWTNGCPKAFITAILKFSAL